MKVQANDVHTVKAIFSIPKSVPNQFPKDLPDAALVIYSSNLQSQRTQARTLSATVSAIPTMATADQYVQGVQKRTMAAESYLSELVTEGFEEAEIDRSTWIHKVNEEVEARKNRPPAPGLAPMVIG